MDFDALDRLFACTPEAPPGPAAVGPERGQEAPATPSPADPAREPSARLEARGERAAIAEHMGGVSRGTAEREAARFHPVESDSGATGARAPIPGADHPEADSPASWHGFTRADLQAAAGLDWPEIADKPEVLDALAAALWTRAQLERGELPAHYTEPVLCECCGPVYLWAGAPARLLGCPWCLVRAPIPRPLVRCGDCGHYLPNETIPQAGLGACRVGAPTRQRQPPLTWPAVLRSCGEWRPRPEVDQAEPTDSAVQGRQSHPVSSEVKQR